MGQKLNTNDAVAKDAQVLLSREECVRNMGQRLNTSDAALNEGCTNQSQRGGICKRHGTYRNNHEESTLSHRVLDRDSTRLLRLIPISALR